MSASSEFTEYVLELLTPTGARPRRMFGGVGIFYDELMFALISDDRLYLKVDDRNREDYESVGSDPFTYETAKGSKEIRSYFEVPAELLDDGDDLCTWAEKAIAAALAADRAKSKAKSKSRTMSAPKT